MKRITQSINGIWEFQVDPAGEGERFNWASSLPNGRPVAVPGYWQFYYPELLHYTGTAWFSRSFEVPTDCVGKTLFLCFAAVDYQAVVYVNGQRIGEHEGGYLPFNLEITQAVQFGAANQVIVAVTDPTDLTEVPHGKQGGGWYTAASGIWQDVTLEARSPVHITDVKVNAVCGSLDVGWKGGEARVSVNLSRPYRYDQALNQVFGVGDVTSDSTVGHGQAHLAPVIADPHHWSPESPWLYNATINLLQGKEVVDQLEIEFGLRSFTWQGGQFYLNGQLIHLRGALDQAYWPLGIYTPPSEDAMIDEIRMAQAMGLNLLRKHIKPEVPAYMRWADRLGILIWSEVACPVRYSDLSRRRLATELEALIDRDYNHPSVVIYSLYNEEWGVDFRLEQDSEKQEWVAALYDRVKAKDPSRLYCDNSGWTHIKTDINDYHKYFASPERGSGWEDELDHMVANPTANWVTACRSDSRGQPIVMSEWGIWGLSDVGSILEDYGGQVYWYDRDWTRFNDFKRQPDALAKFKQLGLNKFFTDFGALATASQWRQWRGVKHQIEEMRRRPGIAGYMVTELQDIEWEGNGWVDYFRRPKVFTHLLPDVNGALAILPWVSKQNLWSGDRFTCDLAIINDTPRVVTDTLTFRFTVGGKLVSTGEKLVKVMCSGRLDLAEVFELTAPNVEGSQSAELALAWGIVKNVVELTVTGSLPPPAVKIQPYKIEPAMIEKLMANGYELGEGPGTVIITQTFDKHTALEAKGARKILYLAEEGFATSEGKSQVTFRRLSPGESWDMASSMFFIDTNRFPGLPLRQEMGWETAQLAPDYVISDLDLPDYKNVVGGYFQGWLGRYAATILERHSGATVGKVLTTTLRFCHAYGIDPIGTAWLHQLINSLSG